MNLSWEMWYHLSPVDWFARVGLGYPAVWIFVGFWIFALGCCFGSFLNVCVWRIPRGESLSRAASHCTTCGTPIRWHDNLPVLSFLLLRGRCRACHARYSSSYFWVELVCGLLFVLALFKTGWSRQIPELIPARFVLIFFAVGIALIDWRHGMIPDRMTLPMFVCGMALAPLLPAVWGTASRLAATAICLLSGVIPAAILGLFALVGKTICRRSVIGWGDIKFLFGIGLLVGLPGGLFALLAGAVTGTAAGLVSGRKPGDAIPFGPYLAAGALVWCFADIWLLNWYKTFCMTI